MPGEIVRSSQKGRRSDVDAGSRCSETLEHRCWEDCRRLCVPKAACPAVRWSARRSAELLAREKKIHPFPIPASSATHSLREDCRRVGADVMRPFPGKRANPSRTERQGAYHAHRRPSHPPERPGRSPPRALGSEPAHNGRTRRRGARARRPFERRRRAKAPRITENDRETARFRLSEARRRQPSRAPRALFPLTSGGAARRRNHRNRGSAIRRVVVRAQ